MTSLSTPQIVANMVIMARTVEPNKTALLIEGDKDTRIYRKVTNPQYCSTFAAGNRLQAEAALTILKSAQHKGVLAVVDADTDHLRGKISTDPDLITTHTRDSECMLLSAPILRTLFVEFDLPSDAFGNDPERATVEAAAFLGYIRFTIEKKKWKVRISLIDFAKFVDSSNLKCNVTALCKHVTQLTDTSGVTPSHYQQELTLLLAKSHDPYQVARGHDITNLLAWAISSRSGKHKKNGAPIKNFMIESYLRTAYPNEAFLITELFKTIEKWEHKNQPFLVLKRP